jgi:RNA polymerase sigma-70 factor, ECF subfamily
MMAGDNSKGAQRNEREARPDVVPLDSDARLVERARNGDPFAFESLVRRHLKGAHAVALSELADARDAEDAVQDAFINALERLDECRDPAAFGAWLRQIVRNRARSVGRRERVRQTESLDVAAPRSSLSDPARDLDRAELRRRLEAALATLTPVQRAVVLMHDLEGYRHREIAAELEIPEGTVRSHLFLARRALRRQLGNAQEVERRDG